MSESNELKTNFQYAIGIDVGGTKILGVKIKAGLASPVRASTLLSESYPKVEITQSKRVETPKQNDDLINAIYGLALELSDNDSSVPIGVGVPGLVDLHGTLRFSPNLGSIRSLPVRELLQERLQRDVFVDNDATCALRAEHRSGAARGYDDALLVTLGTGIGGGIVSSGSVVNGSNGFAGEIGHMVVDPFGPLCPCGRQGCWERYASGAGLGRLGREAGIAGKAKRVLDLAGGDGENIRGEHVTHAAMEGDVEALQIVKNFGWWIALGLANLASALDPGVIVMGGGVVESGGVWLDASREAFTTMLEGLEYRPEVPILAAHYGERSGAVGAAHLALEGAITK